MENDYYAATLTLWSQLDSKGKVGGVHSKSVRLAVSESAIPYEGTEDFEEFFLPKTKRQLTSCRTGMKIVGGQAYHPLLKANSLVEQRCNLGQLMHLPLLLQRVLSTTCGSFDENKTKIHGEVIAKFETLKALLNNMSSEWRNSAKNTVRFEFFVTTTMRNARCDITLPVPNLWEQITVVDHQPFKNYMAGYTKVYISPLSNFVADLKKTVVGDDKKKQIIEVGKIGPEIRTCLVFCAEKCVEAANLLGFSGRIVNLIWRELSHIRYQGLVDFFVLPASVLVKVQNNRYHSYALKQPRILQPTPNPNLTLTSGSESESSEVDQHGKLTTEASWLAAENGTMANKLVFLISCC
jgi:hypothetical protein